MTGKSPTQNKMILLTRNNVTAIFLWIRSVVPGTFPISYDQDYMDKNRTPTTYHPFLSDLGPLSQSRASNDNALP
jgi:hypothetical protein